MLDSRKSIIGNNKTKILGGMFGLRKAIDTVFHDSSLLFLERKNLLLANARSGIAILVDLLTPPQVWMPSYLCDVMVKAVRQVATRTKLKFYEVSYDLQVPSLEWLENITEGDLVVFIDYFGFSYDRICAIRAKERGAWILEDASQALLSTEVGQFSDFILFSPRKFLGVPDGGILVVNCEVDLQCVDLKSPPADWWLKAFYATVLRREFDIHGGGRHWFNLFREADVQGPIGRYAMSELSKMLLKHSFDYSHIAQKRIDNYRFLSDSLSDLAIFPELFPGVVPLGFPIRMKNRDQVRKILFEHEIYPPVHWSIQDVVPEEFKNSHRLAAEIMTLLCDQRYESDDMERMAQLVLKAIRLR